MRFGSVLKIEKLTPRAIIGTDDSAERQTLNALAMEVRRNQNKELADQVEEEPGDRQANDHANRRLEPSCGSVGGFDRGGLPPKAARA